MMNYRVVIESYLGWKTNRKYQRYQAKAYMLKSHALFLEDQVRKITLAQPMGIKEKKTQRLIQQKCAQRKIYRKLASTWHKVLCFQKQADYFAKQIGKSPIKC